MLNRKSGGLLVAAVVVVAVAGVGGWLAGKKSDRTDAPPAPAVAAADGPRDGARGTITPAAPPTGAGTEGGTAASSATIAAGTPDPFAALQCQARQFNDALALAVSFTQPVDRRNDLSSFLEVVDMGQAKSQGDEGSEAKASDGKIEAGAAGAKGKRIEGNWVVSDNPRTIYFPFVSPDHRYAISLRGNLPAATEKVTLKTPVNCVVATEAMAPAFYFSSRGVVLPAGQNGGLPVTTVNTPEVDVQFLRVAPEKAPALYEKVLGVTGGAQSATDEDESESEAEDDEDYRDYDDRTTSLKGLVGNWDLDRLNTLTTSVYQGRFVTDDKPNLRHVTFLPVETIKELQEPGIYIAVMSQPGRFRYEYQVTYFYVTDIGLHTRRYQGGLEAFAVSLKTGTPISGARVEIVDGDAKSLANATTDAKGHVRFDGDFERARLVRASRGKETTVLALGEPALDMSEYSLGGHPSRNTSLFVYSGRALYRPGEQFNVSILPRDADGRILPAAPLTATLKRADGRVVQTSLWSPQEKIAGYVQREISLPADAQTGTWTLELRVDPGARAPDASWTFQVEEFLPERMKLALTQTDKTPKIGDTLNIAVQGDYLYGAPAAGNRLLSRYQVRRQKEALPDTWPGFIFGDVADDDTRTSADLPEAELDDTGAGELDVDPGLTDAHSPMQVRVSASLLESGGRPVVRSIESTFWPADKLIGVRPLFDRNVTREGTAAAFELIRVSTDGTVAPIKGAQVRMFREERRYYWRYDDQRGWNSGYTETEDLLDSRTIDLDARTPLSIPVGYGRYRLEVRDPETGLTARYRFYAGWGAQDAESVGNRPDRVQMKLTALPATPGKSVTLNFTPPHDGQALITVESDRLLWSKWVDAKATGTDVDIPLDGAWKRSDLYVSAVVFRPGSAGDRVTPARAVGITHLPLDNAARRLDVKIEAATKVEPEKRSEVAISVPGAAGKTAHVTLSAVDVGILNITQYRTPDPFDFFFGKHRYAADWLDMYGKLIEKMDGTLGRLKWGGDAAMRGNSRSLPKKVKLVDLFSGPLALDAQGRARIPLDLPDFNGTLRLMAVAFTEDQYGSSDAEMVVAAPIVAELNTPRFITPGDRAAVALDLTNLSGAPQTVTLNLRADSPLAIADGTRTVKLADKQRTTVRFEATTLGANGLAPVHLTVDATGGPKPIHIVRESVLQVQPAYAAQRVVRRMRVGPGESVPLPPEVLAGLYPDTLTSSLAVSSKPPINMARQVRELLSYPYGCTEQTISASFPWLVIDEPTAERYAIKGFTDAARASKVRGAIERLAGMRNAAGAYSLWGDAGSRDVWLTAYAVGFLQDARDRGYEVSERDLSRSRDWLLEQLQQAPNAFGTWSQRLQMSMINGNVASGDDSVLREDHRRFASYAAAALVLARDKRAPLSTLRTLFDNYQLRARSPLPLVQFAAAFKLLGDEPRSQQAATMAEARNYGIPRNGNSYSGEDWLGDYGSFTRDLALSYALAVQYKMLESRREVWLTDLSDRVDRRQYLSTQEQLALVMAARAAGGEGKPWALTVASSGGQQILESRTDRTLTLKPEELSTLQLVNTGSEPVFAELDVSGVPTTAPAPRRDVIQLKRTWYLPNGTPWNGGALTTGDILVVRVNAQARTAMPNALVVDRVPAGMEIDNMNLSQSPDMADWTIGGKRVAETFSDARIKHREFRDDRYVAAVELGRGEVDVFYMLRVVTPGRYSVPAVEAEDMYRPELRGVGDAWRPVEIRDRTARAAR